MHVCNFIFMFNSGRPPGPVWNEKGKTQFGGVMTLLYVPLVAIYVYFLVVGIVTAPTQVSFEHVNPVPAATRSQNKNNCVVYLVCV